MKFVVPIPLWLYIIGFLVVASLVATIGVYVLAGIIAIGFLYFLWVLGSKRRQSGLFLSKDSNALWRF